MRLWKWLPGMFLFKIQYAMKTKYTVSLLIFIIVLAGNFKLSAQVLKRYLTIGEVSIPIDNVIMLDSVGEDKQLSYKASFDVQIKSGNQVAILVQLQSLLTSKTPSELALSTLNFKMAPLEERTYTESTIEEIIFPELKADGRESLSVRVKIKAKSVNINQHIFKKPSGNSVRPSTGLVSNFRMDIDKLPGNRITSIGNIILRSGNDKEPFFYIEMSEVDAKLWREWLVTGNDIKKQGVIELLTPNLKDVIMRLKLTDVQIVSNSTRYKSTDTQPSTTIIGLRVGAVEVMADK